MNRSKDPRYFTGNERLEVFPFIATLIRKGTPQALAVSDRDKTLESVREGRFEEAKQYLEMIHYSHTGMVTLILEWALQWPSSLEKLHGADEERRCTKAAFSAWSHESASILTSQESRQAIEFLSRVFSHEAAKPGVAERYRKEIAPKFRGKRTIAGDLLRKIGDGQSTSNALVCEKNTNGFEEHFLRYWDFVRSAHDGIVQYVQSYPATVTQLLGQKACDDLLHRSFSDCSFFELLWTLLHALNPHELAAFYADHLRTHFSGSGRGGATTIIEEPDRYRLVFDACGSGGAMRRRASEAGSPVETLSDASPATWGLKDQVPAYCSHCAINEIESIKRFGFPVATTEFDPDPFKPCGWTIYKDPSKIPDRYFERVGARKDPKLFKKDGLKYKTFRLLGDTLGLKMRVQLPDLSQ